MQIKMSLASWLCLLTHFTHVSLTYSSTCPPVKYRLRSNISLQDNVNIMCSTDKRDISTPTKKVNILEETSSIGIYILNTRDGQACYFQPVKNGLIPLKNMTGGTYYAVGKLESKILTTFKDTLKAQHFWYASFKITDSYPQ